MSMKFFGKEGITSTSANHLANIAKEYLTSQHAIIDNISFVDEKVSIHGQPAVQTRVGVKDISVLLPAIDKIGQYHAFIAYLREAIKAKDEALKNIDSFSMYWDKNYSDCVVPSKPTYPSFNEILQTKTIKEQAEYYRLEALCAAIGKAIHPGGSYHNARQFAYTSLSNPAEVKDYSVTIRSLSIDIKSVDDTYFELQRQHRQFSARLNAFKHSVVTEIDKIIQDLDLEYQKNRTTYDSIREKAIAEYNLWYKDEQKKISSLKIVIPHELEGTYKFFSEL